MLFSLKINIPPSLERKLYRESYLIPKYPHGSELLRFLNLSRSFNTILRSTEAEALRIFGDDSEIGFNFASPPDEFA
jgi:hypothetical protein